jgi:hypothetical protein
MKTVRPLRHLLRLPLPALLLLLLGCQEDLGLAKAPSAAVHVKLDFAARPLPEIPLPNDLATRYDATSPTKRRVNASMVAPTGFERRTRELVDQLDGWGVYSPISVPFDGPIDPQSIASRHHGDDFAFANDAVYLVDVTPGSPTYGQPREIDLGNGNFPVVLEQLAGYWKSDVRGDTLSLLFDEHDEDKNGNGQLDAGEDTDLDGFLDRGNYKPGTTKKMADMNLAERADALLSFYERETHTLLARPLVPLRQRTTYAVLITNRVLDEKGKPVGSPFTWNHHLAQAKARAPLPEILAARKADFGGLGVRDVAFAWTFTTASIEADLQAVRQGLYGKGAQQHLAQEYPPQVKKLFELVDKDHQKPYETPYTLSGESFISLATLLAQGGLVSFGGDEQKKRFLAALPYVGHHFLGTYESPQLFNRQDEQGNYLGYNDQSWPPDVSVKPAKARAEDVTFWATVPRKEATATGKPKALVILGHGYTSSKTEMFGFHHFFSKMGLAVVAIDNVSHGFSVSGSDKETLDTVFGAFGVSGLAKALTSNRSWDQDLDGVEDSGADYWTAYTFHTRDVVRQTAVDYAQLVRVERGFDGKRLWPADINGNGKADDIAGDLDGDGTVDFGGPAMPIVMLGGSLGGIMSAVVGGLEPELDAVVPVSGGAGLIDVSLRSIQGGVREAVSLRLMGPLYVGVPDPVAGTIAVKTVIPSLNDTAEVEVARLSAEEVAKLAPGDGLRADNLSNGEYDCARLLVDKGCADSCAASPAIADKTTCAKRCLTFRVALASDIVGPRQTHTLDFYSGEAFQLGVRDPVKHRACKLVSGAKPVVQVHQFGQTVKFHARSAPLHFAKGEPLAPLAEGLGLHRARPSLRRFLGFAQMVLDPADPAIWAQHFADPENKTHALVVNTVGDMNVPVSTGAAIGRSAGLLDWKAKVAEWGGRTLNQVLVDTFVLEAVDKIPRFVDPNGNGVLFDPEDLSKSAGLSPVHAALPPAGQKVQYASAAPRGNDGFNVPRLSPPLHTKAVGKDAFGGVSGTFFPYIEPGGKHGFWEPGAHYDMLFKQCKADATAAGQDPNSCKGKDFFDHGSMVVAILGRYMATAGKEFAAEACMSSETCADILPPPKPRD